MAQRADGTVYINSSMDVTGFKAGGKEIEAAARRAAKTVGGIGDSARAAMNKQLEAVASSNQAYNQQAQKVEELKKKVEELRQQKVTTDEFKEIEKQIENDTKEMNKLIKRQKEFVELGGSKEDSFYTGLQERIEELRNSIKYATAEKEELINSGEAYTGEVIDATNTEEYRNALKEFENEMATLNQYGLSTQESFLRLMQRVQQLGGSVSGIARLNEAASELENTVNKIIHPVETVKNAFSSLVFNIKDRLAGIAASIINSVAHPFKTMGKIAKNSVGNVKKMFSEIISVAKKVGSSVKVIASKLLGIGKSSKSASKGLNSMSIGFKNILKYGFGIRSVYALVNKFRTAVKEGFQNLAQYSDPVNVSLSSLKSALTQLKNSLATAFAPILTVIAPALTTFINLVSKAATAIGMLIAALTGQKTFVKAKEVQEDYTASLENTADAAKEADKYLSGLDEIRTFSEDKDSSGGGGASGISPADMFETVNISSSIADLAEKIKEAWKNADFTEIGAEIGAKLKNALEGIPWEKIQKTAGKLGKSLATLLNGVFETKGLGTTVGKTLANALNTGIELAYEFITNFHWDSFGKFIGDAVNGAVSDFEWSKLGETIGGAINGIVSAAKNFFQTTNFQTLGKSIADSVNSAISTTDWGEVAETLSLGIEGALDTAIGFLEELVPEEIADAISDFFVGIDWGGIFGRVALLINDAFYTVFAIGNKLGQNLTKWLADWFHSIGWESAAGYFDGLTNRIKMHGEVVKKGFQMVVDWVKEKLGIHSPSTVFADIGKNTMEGFVNGVKSFIGNVLSTFAGIKNKILSKFSDIKDKFLAKGKDIMTGIKSGISEKWSDFISFWTSKKEAIINKFSTIKDKFTKTGKNIISGIRSGISEMWSAFSGWWTEKRDSIVDKFSSIRDKMANVGKNIINGIIDGIKSIWDTLAGWAQKIIDMFTISVKSTSGGGTSAASGAASAIMSVPSGVSTYSAAMPTLASAPIPYLATGAVIPPNAPFMAVLGDQKNGKNLEMPENLLRKIVREESGGNGVGIKEIRIPLIVSGKQMLEVILTEAQLKQMQNGRNPFEMA